MAPEINPLKPEAASDNEDESRGKVGHGGGNGGGCHLHAVQHEGLEQGHPSQRQQDELKDQPVAQLRWPFLPLEVEGEREGEDPRAEAAEGDEEERVEAERQDRRQHHHVGGAGQLHAHQPQRDRRVLPPPRRRARGRHGEPATVAAMHVWQARPAGRSALPS